MDVPICTLNVGPDDLPYYSLTVCFIGAPAGLQPPHVVLIVGAELILLQPRELEGPSLSGNCLSCLLTTFLHQLLYCKVSLEDYQMSPQDISRKFRIIDIDQTGEYR